MPFSVHSCCQDIDNGFFFVQKNFVYRIPLLNWEIFSSYLLVCKNQGLQVHIVRDGNTKSGNRFQLRDIERSHFSIERPQIIKISQSLEKKSALCGFCPHCCLSCTWRFSMSLSLFLQTKQMQFVQFFFVGPPFLDSHYFWCSPLESFQLIHILKIGVCLSSCSTGARNTGCPCQSRALAVTILLFFLGKIIEYYFRQLSFIHVYNNVLVFLFYTSGFSEANYWHLRFRWSGDAPSELLRKFRNYEI